MGYHSYIGRGAASYVERLIKVLTFFDSHLSDDSSGAHLRFDEYVHAVFDSHLSGRLIASGFVLEKDEKFSRTCPRRRRVEFDMNECGEARCDCRIYHALSDSR